MRGCSPHPASWVALSVLFRLELRTRSGPPWELRHKHSQDLGTLGEDSGGCSHTLSHRTQLGHLSPSLGSPSGLHLPLPLPTRVSSPLKPPVLRPLTEPSVLPPKPVTLPKQARPWLEHGFGAPRALSCSYHHRGALGKQVQPLLH
ncbi:hypothetical protein VULLAG_LOCUS3199 [Vulpes lagopus]